MDKLKDKLENMNNNLSSNKVVVGDQLCISDVCMDKEQLKKLKSTFDSLV